MAKRIAAFENKEFLTISINMGIIYESNISGLTRNENFEKVKSTGCDPVLFLDSSPAWRQSVSKSPYTYIP